MVAAPKAKSDAANTRPSKFFKSSLHKRIVASFGDRRRRSSTPLPSIPTINSSKSTNESNIPERSLLPSMRRSFSEGIKTTVKKVIGPRRASFPRPRNYDGTVDSFQNTYDVARPASISQDRSELEYLKRQNLEKTQRACALVRNVQEAEKAEMSQFEPKHSNRSQSFLSASSLSKLEDAEDLECGGIMRWIHGLRGSPCSTHKKVDCVKCSHLRPESPTTGLQKKVETISRESQSSEENDMSHVAKEQTELAYVKCLEATKPENFGPANPNCHVSGTSADRNEITHGNIVYCDAGVQSSPEPLDKRPKFSSALTSGVPSKPEQNYPLSSSHKEIDKVKALKSQSGTGTDERMVEDFESQTAGCRQPPKGRHLEDTEAAITRSTATEHFKCLVSKDSESEISKNPRLAEIKAPARSLAPLDQSHGNHPLKTSEDANVSSMRRLDLGRTQADNTYHQKHASGTECTVDGTSLPVLSAEPNGDSQVGGSTPSKRAQNMLEYLRRLQEPRCPCLETHEHWLPPTSTPHLPTPGDQRELQEFMQEKYRSQSHMEWSEWKKSFESENCIQKLHIRELTRALLRLQAEQLRYLSQDETPEWAF